MISIDRVEDAARSIVLRNEALEQIISSEESMLVEQPHYLQDGAVVNATEALDDHRRKFYPLSRILAEVASPFKKIRDLCTPEAKIVIGDGYDFRYSNQTIRAWRRSMMFIYHAADRTYDGVMVAEASAERRGRGFFRRNLWTERILSIGQIPSYLDEEYVFSFDELERRSGKASADFDFVTTTEDILSMRGVIDEQFPLVVPLRYGINHAPFGGKIQVENIVEVERRLAEIMAMSQAFRDQAEQFYR